MRYEGGVWHLTSEGIVQMGRVHMSGVQGVEVRGEQKVVKSPTTLPNTRPFLQDFAKAGCNMFTFHLEAAADESALNAESAHPAVVELAQAVKAAGMQVGCGAK